MILGISNGHLSLTRRVDLEILNSMGSVEIIDIDIADWNNRISSHECIIISEHYVIVIYSAILICGTVI